MELDSTFSLSNVPNIGSNTTDISNNSIQGSKELIEKLNNT